MTTLPTKLLETERLLLRRLTPADLDLLAALYADPAVSQYMDTTSYEETKAEIEWVIDIYDSQPGFGLWATIHKQTGDLIGRCGLLQWTVEDRPEVELAYLLAKAYWGQGLATEAAQALMAYAFDQLHLTRLVCFIDPPNHASIKVAQKIGMTLEKEIEIEGLPVLVYSNS